MQNVGRIAQDPYKYLQKISGELDTLDTRAKIDPVLDELEFIHEILEPEEQPMVTQLVDILMKRYQTLSS